MSYRVESGLSYSCICHFSLAFIFLSEEKCYDETMLVLDTHVRPEEGRKEGNN